MWEICRNQLCIVMLSSAVSATGARLSTDPSTDRVNQVLQFTVTWRRQAVKRDKGFLRQVDAVEEQRVQVDRAAFGFKFSALPKR